MRRIETEVGVLCGTVDRVTRRVFWTLECPDCQEQIGLTAETFTGKQPPTCACGWREPPQGAMFPDSVAQYFDFTAAFETVPAGA